LDTREEKTCHPLREAIQLNAVALLYRKKRREGKKREKMSSTKGSNEESLLFFHTVVYVYVYVLAGTGQANIRTGYLLYREEGTLMQLCSKVECISSFQNTPRFIF